jgi:Tfp pilus assembly protein PilO
MKIQVEKKIIIIAGTVAMVMVASVLMIVPLWNKAGSKAAEVKILEEEMLSARQALQSGKKLQKTGTLLTRRKISLAIDEMTKIGAANNVNFQSISPQKITKKKDAIYPVLPIRMVLQSGYQDLGAFFGALEGLEESIITVKSFQIEADPQALPLVRTDLVVEVYLREGEDG